MSINEPLSNLENPINVVHADIELFDKHKEEILEIERSLIQGSSSDYFFDREDELNFMTDAIAKGGYALLAMDNGKVVGFLVVGPLADGGNLPHTLLEKYPVEKCLHMKVMYVKASGKGIGGALLEDLVEGIDRSKWNYLFVRTWVEPANLGAIKFYTEKAGFVPVEGAVVESEKLSADKSHTFQIKRQYFVRGL